MCIAYNVSRSKDLRHIYDLCRTYAKWHSPHWPQPSWPQPDLSRTYAKCHSPHIPQPSWLMLDLCLTTSTYVWSHLPMSDNIYLCLTTFKPCQWPSRHRPQRDLPLPHLTSAGPMPNFKIWDQKVNVVKKMCKFVTFTRNLVEKIHLASNL
jgi:hypothetical protein